MMRLWGDGGWVAQQASQAAVVGVGWGAKDKAAAVVAIGAARVGEEKGDLMRQNGVKKRGGVALA